MSKPGKSTDIALPAPGNRLGDLVPTESAGEGSIRSPQNIIRRVDQLTYRQKETKRNLKEVEKKLAAVEALLGIADQVTDALDLLSEQLFRKELDILEEKLTIALDEVLGQSIKFRSDVSTKRGQASIEFYIEREGNKEDIQKGSGGSVQNILSVGLRFFALQRLAEQEHRRFVVLDEQDCWLRPDVVPNLVKVIDAVVRELGFQIIVISHHDISLFEQYADKIYRFEPVRTPDGAATVKVVEATSARTHEPGVE
ncbi:MAG: DNA repair protein [Planctomycetota bacterium]